MTGGSHWGWFDGGSGLSNATAALPFTEPPQFVKEPERHITAEMEKVVAIPCQAKGELLPSHPPCATVTLSVSDVPPALAGVPPPEMAWYKDAALIVLEKLSRFQLLADGSLQISGLLPDDTGMFQCFARNAAGEVQTTTYLAVTSRCQPPAPLDPGWAPQGPWGPRETLPWGWDPLWSGSAPG